MKIDRKELVSMHNPVLNGADARSPLTVGNGELACTVDVTGMQTLYRYYEEEKMPLCTMAQWGWHTEPADETGYDFQAEDLIETEYEFQGRRVRYPVECAPGNEEVYHWLRKNPHRLNLGRIGLLWKGSEIEPDQLSEMHQELDLYSGIITSTFRIEGEICTVKTACSPDQDSLAFLIESEAASDGRLTVLLAFPYGSPSISASEFNRPCAHQTEVSREKNGWRFDRKLDKNLYSCLVYAGETVLTLKEKETHFFELGTDQKKLGLTVSFLGEQMPEETGNNRRVSAEKILIDSIRGWEDYWNKTGIIRLNQSKDSRAAELERRIILSQYLLAVQSSGSMPPQETGLTCNSWYGKFHLEMYFWHEAYLPLWGRTDMLERSLGWFEEHLPQARENAAKNGYRGARWPKMVGPSGVDSPSPIAPLLIWQQPHIIYMLHLCYLDRKKLDFVRRYYPLIKESADFMADFAVKNENGEYELLPPLIPVQECHPPKETKNPVFEIEYWVLGLRIALKWAELLGEEAPEEWREVCTRMKKPMPDKDGLYQAWEGCSDTYKKYAKDHPSFLMALGVIDTGRLDQRAMERSLEKSLEVWDETSLWGWDFAVMAMTAVKLNRPEFAIELLLKKTAKNVYVVSGNNRQVSREDLPLYLPGNGSLLLAAAMMAAGYEGCDTPCPGFPKDGNWSVQFEGIHPMPEILLP